MDDTSGVTYEELVTIMGHIMPSPEVDIREGLASALWRFGEVARTEANTMKKTSNIWEDVLFLDFRESLTKTRWNVLLGRRRKRLENIQRYQRRYTRNARPRPSKRHGERRGVK